MMGRLRHWDYVVFLAIQPNKIEEETDSSQDNACS